MLELLHDPLPKRIFHANGIEGSFPFLQFLNFFVSKLISPSSVFFTIFETPYILRNSLDKLCNQMERSINLLYVNELVKRAVNRREDCVSSSFFVSLFEKETSKYQTTLTDVRVCELELQCH